MTVSLSTLQIVIWGRNVGKYEFFQHSLLFFGYAQLKQKQAEKVVQTCFMHFFDYFPEAQVGGLPFGVDQEDVENRGGSQLLLMVSILPSFIIKQMKGQTFLVLLLSLTVIHAQWSYCPSPSALKIVQQSLTISNTGIIPLQQGQDIQCYNYVFSNNFNCTPNIAIAINNFEAYYSPHLFFSIKVAASSSFTTIPFIVRTHWGYTQWRKISFSFIAEATSQVEAGYYQIDTSTLSSCSSGKQIIANLPIVDQQPTLSKALVFLNGFQISSVQSSQSFSPYEVSLVIREMTHKSITVIIQSTSLTQIHSIFISFLAYDANIINSVSGVYTYDQYSPSFQLQFTSPSGIANTNLAMHGFNSFIIKNGQQNFQLSATFINSQLSISSTSQMYYLGYSYFFLVGGPCGQCPGYSIHYDNKCVASCPPGSFYNGQTCIRCDPGYTWDGSKCINRCNPQQIWDSIKFACVCANGGYWNGQNCVTCHSTQVWDSNTNRCICALGGNWNGFVCISCSHGQVWNPQSYSCICPQGSSWNGVTCITCPNGQVWSTQTRQCQCPFGTNWNGNTCMICPSGLVWNNQINGCGCPPGQILFQGSCAVIPTCRTGQILDVASNRCICQQGANWNGFTCIVCTNGQVWNGIHCACPQNMHWNSYSCINCPQGQVWSANLNACSCPRGQNWDGFNCVTCGGGRSWNPSINSCSCPFGQHWNGAICMSCPGNTNFNGFSCITCDQGKIWNPANSVCQCPSGQQWDGSICTTPCPSGMSSVNGICSCPPKTYSLNGRCIPQPNCPSGQTWDGFRCLPIQCPAGTFWNISQCMNTPTQNCPAGTYYDGYRCSTNTTYCPFGTSWDGFSCQSSGQCPNGYYKSGAQCIPISQTCPNGLVWKNGQCVLVNNQCPQGTYLSGGSCIPVQPCGNGQVWNSTFLQCTCPMNSFWNGQQCIQCQHGQSYQVNSGCFCPTGLFLMNGRCSSIPINQCASIANAIWNGQACVCNPGYSPIGTQCVCSGLAVNNQLCDRCYTKPNSQWKNGICMCKTGYVETSGRCVKSTPNPNPPTTPSCNVATYWDDQQLRCLPCSSGCLSCITCYVCTSCQPGFNMDFTSSLCVETCGDGKRYTLDCDDGNNINGDGCTNDCKIEVGNTCSGGSPNSKDTCSRFLPQSLSFESTGQSHLYGKIVLNVKLNYLPLPLIESATDCENKCNNVLKVDIVSGDRSTTGIVASYIATTSFSFSIEIDFGREPIGIFTVEIGVNPNLIQKYFSGINASHKLRVDVNPAFLSLAQYGQTGSNVDILV